MRRFHLILLGLLLLSACADEPRALPLEALQEGEADFDRVKSEALQKGDYDTYAASFNLSDEDQKMLAGMVEEKVKEDIDKKGAVKVDDEWKQEFNK